MKLNISDLESGMFIKICKNPEFSIQKHGSLEGYKQKLAGTIQKILKIYVSTNRVYIVPPPGCGYEQISFNICDIRRIEEGDIKADFIKPITFDPNQLDI